MCCDRIWATDRATFMARATVDGLPIGQSMATAVCATNERGLAPPREQRPESDLPSPDTETYTLVGLGRSLASGVSAKRLYIAIRGREHRETGGLRCRLEAAGSGSAEAEPQERSKDIPLALLRLPRRATSEIDRSGLRCGRIRCRN